MQLNFVLNSKIKYFGLSIWSIASSILGAIVGIGLFGGIGLLIGSSIGILLGLKLSNLWEANKIQEFLFWDLKLAPPVKCVKEREFV